MVLVNCPKCGHTFEDDKNRLGTYTYGGMTTANMSVRPQSDPVVLSSMQTLVNQSLKQGQEERDKQWLEPKQ